MPGEDRNAELGTIRAERDMGSGRESQLVFVDAEDRVDFEVDALNVGRDRVGSERRSEAQSNVLRVEAQKVIEQFRPRGLSQTVNRNVAHCRSAWPRRVVTSGPGRRAASGNRPTSTH